MSTGLDIYVTLLCCKNMLDAGRCCTCVRSIYAAHVICFHLELHFDKQAKTSAHAIVLGYAEHLHDISGASMQCRVTSKHGVTWRGEHAWQSPGRFSAVAWAGVCAKLQSASHCSLVKRRSSACFFRAWAVCRLKRMCTVPGMAWCACGRMRRASPSTRARRRRGGCCSSAWARSWPTMRSSSARRGTSSFSPRSTGNSLVLMCVL